MKFKTVLLTGATGFLGDYLAQGFLKQGVRLKLLLRNTSSPNASYGFCGTSKNLEFITGDITKEYLGLEKEVYLRLQAEVDEVFHCAAATRFDDHFDNTLVNTNVRGTERILRFCLFNKPKRLHYVSTAYVAGVRRDTVFEHELEKGQAFNNDYEKSKFEAERLVSSFARQWDIPVTIYRPSIIVGDSRTGFTKKYDNIYVFGKGLCRLKNYEMRNNYQSAGFISRNCTGLPTSLRINGDMYSTINLIPVDYASNAIVAIAMQTKSINKTFHIVNPSPPTLGELTEWMKVATGFHHVRIASAREFQIHPPGLQERQYLQGTEAFQPYMFGEPDYDSTNTRNLLSGTGIECPLITQELISRFIQYAIDTNWGKKKQPLEKRINRHKDREEISVQAVSL